MINWCANKIRVCFPQGKGWNVGFLGLAFRIGLSQNDGWRDTEGALEQIRSQLLHEVNALNKNTNMNNQYEYEYKYEYE